MTTMCGRAVGFWKIKPAIAVVILLAVAATLGSVPAVAGTPAVPVKTQPITPPIDAEDAPALVIVGAPQLQAMDSHIHVPQTGIASLYWAVRHPTRAWRILLPAQ